MAAALTDAQLWSVVSGAGWTGEDALKAFAIALAESGGRPDAKNTGNRNGSTDYGLFQINSVHADLLKSGNWQDPTANARMAKKVFDDAHGKFTPWATYNSQSYVRFLSRAQAASSGKSKSKSGTLSIADEGEAAPDSAATKIAAVTAGNTWIRVSYFLVGAILLLIFAISLIKNTSIVRAATNVIPVARAVKGAGAVAGAAVKDSVKTVAGK